MRHGRIWLAFPVMVLAGWALVSLAQPPKKADPPPPGVKDKDDEPSADELKEKAVAERFQKVLETNPRRGTALDRLYGYHVERGTLDKLIGDYAARTKKDAKDGVAWMIVGLLESQRGKDAAAVTAFRQAEAALAGNPIPSYYLGQSLVLVGQPDLAAEAYERAITRKPPRNDLLDVFQALGRVHQRAQRSDKALDVWNRLEKLFPDDARVQEQIVTTLVEEGQFDQALPRLEKLAAATEDAYRKSSFRIDIAELKVKLKKTPEALVDFEKLLAELNPESWLHRDVRRRVEDVFLRGDDLAGLAKYYEKWLEKNPADVDAFARLAKNLATQGRTPEARAWLEKGTAVAPNNRSLRQALIDQYVFEQNFAAAAQQYEAMDKADPNNPDTLREWGKMLLKDASRPEADRRAAAAAVWKRILEKKPTDPVTTSQVADLMRTANATDEAIALYTKAIQLAPDAAQYREYLGEYFHSLKRSPEAIATWRPIAGGPNRNAKNLARLAEVFAGFGYRKEAIGAMADAVRLDKEDFVLLMTYAQLLHEDDQHDLALQQIAAASTRTSNPEEVEQVLNAQIKVFQATDRLPERITELEKELAAGKDVTADRWLRLARYCEANRRLDKASEAIAKASEKDGKAIPVLIAAARIYESSGNMLAAADTNRKLALLDRRYRTEYLQAVAKLEQRLGRREQALQAGRDVMTASPGNPEVYKFFADLCFQLGDPEEGLDALRRSVRANPSDPAGLITLAHALSERLRQGEAIELLWRAFEKSNELEGKLGIIDRITQLYLENNQFDRLMERLERERRESDKAREMAMCIAQAYSTAGDLGTARAQLERLLTENNRDVNLLGQLVSLCESEGDLAAALKYQRLINAAAPNNYDHQLKLAQLLTRSGEAEEAADIWVKLVADATESHRNLSAIDQLLTAGKTDNALAILSRMLAQKPGNWELVYREGAALMAKDKPDEAAARFNALLSVKIADDELSDITKNQIKQAKKKAAAAPKPGQPVAFNPFLQAQFDENARPGLLRRTGNVSRIRQVTGMEARYYYGGQPQQPFYAPADFGEARMACLGFLSERARLKGTSDAFVKHLREAKDKAGADPRPLWDWFYFQNLRNDYKDRVATAFTLSQGPDPAGLLAYLNAVTTRTYANPNRVVRRGPGGGEAKDTTPPLPADQLAHALACYKKLKSVKPEWVTNEVTQTVMTELKRANKEAEETAIYKGLVAEATTIDKLVAAIQLATTRRDVDTAVDLFVKLDKLQGPAKTAAALAQLPTRQATAHLEYLVAHLADDKRMPEALRVFDLTLATARRQNLAAPPSTTRRAPQGGGLSGNVPGKNQKSYSVTYPSANEYYDFQMLHLMYTAFAKYQAADLLSDLITHIRNQAAAAQGAERMYMLLALGYMHWWNEEKDEAIAQLQQAISLVPGDHNLLLEVATLREQNGEPDAALALLDTIAPLDTQMMQRREEAAMRLAERTGNVERARVAAERLFGLRLDADKQLELAAKMHRLGMAKMAETVLNRAQRQAGNKSGTLLRLMTQYQSQNQTDLAVQIARQILRKGPSTNVNNPRGGMEEVDHARQQAVGVLARSGQLKEMIERAEAQLKASPKSVQIHQALLGYYQAAGDKEKLKATLVKMAEIKPDDGKLRYQIAQQLQQAGERDAALTHYKAAIKLDPSVLGYRYWEIQNLFAQADKYEELAQVMDEIDLRKVGQYYYVSELVSSLLQNDKGRDMGLKLFKKSWDAFPQYRGQFLGRLYDDAVWRLPEIYAYAKEAVIPREDSEIDPWQSATEIMSYGSEGRVDGVITRTLSIARKQQRLPELKAEIQTAIAKRPDWVGGQALLAIIEIQSGNKEAGKKLWLEAFAPDRTDIPPLARFILTQELEFYAGVEDIAVKTLEGGIDDMMKDGNYEYSYSPARRLVWWYEQMGRKDDAKKLQLRFATADNVDPNYSGSYRFYQNVQNKFSIAQEFQRTGDTVEAVRIYNGLLADKESLDIASQYGGEGYEQMVENGLREALKAIKPNTLPAAVGSLLTPREVTPTTKAVLDLVVLVDSRDLAKANLNSVFASAIKSTEKAPEVRKEALAKLADLTKKHPADFSVHAAAALAAFADGKPEGIRAAVDRLAKLVETVPLEPLPANGKANARHRADAQPQIPLWLVARECFAKDREAFREAGEKLAVRAVEAARRQQNPLQAAAILREWGQIELDRGDKAKAEARFTEMLELMLPKPKPAAAVGLAPTPGTPVPAVPGVAVPPAKMPQSRDHRDDGTVLIVAQVATPVPAQPLPAGKTAPPAARGGPPVLTIDQFQHAYAVAGLAADKNLPGLSVRAMKDAMKGGPPVPGKLDRQNFGGGRLVSRTIGGTMYYVEEMGAPQISVEQALGDLVPKWRAIGVPPAEIYDVVLTAVLPDSRPAEVFLNSEGRVYGTVYTLAPGGYLTPATGIDGEGGEGTGSMGDLLCTLAVEANKVDALRAKIQTRAGQPLGELPAQVLLATLAVKAKDDARAAEAFKTLGARIQKDSLQGTNDRAAAVLVPALADPKFTALVAPFVAKAAENYATGNNTQRAVELRFELARQYLKLKNEAAARAQFDVVEEFGKKVGRNEYDVYTPLAVEYLKAGWADDALRALGVRADNMTAAGADPRARARRQEPALGEFPQLVRLLLEMPAARRYDALKAWTLPTEGRKSVRYYVGVMPKEFPPVPFVKLPPMPAGEVVSTMLLLADAAKEVGKLDELTGLAEKFAADKVENAETFLVLLKLAQGKGKEAAAAVKAFAEAAHKRMTDKPEQGIGPRYSDYEDEERQPQPVHPSEFLYATMCLADPALAAHGELLLKPMLDRAQATQNTEYIHRVRAVWDRLGASRAGAPDALANGMPPRWHPITPRATWFAQDGYLLQARNERPSFLAFDTPLAGTFEFSVDVYQGTWAEGHAGYAGVVYEPNRQGVASSVWAVGHHDQVYKPAAGIRTDQFNRLTFQVSPGKVRCLLNGQPFYEDTDAPATAPWLMLYAGNGRRPVFRNPTLTGKPEVPAEVKLSGGDALGGWHTFQYGGSLPLRMLPKEQAQGDARDQWGNPIQPEPNAGPKKEPKHDWQAKGGEILGRKLERPGEKPVPSCLAYFRPLRTGETLTYEFFHDPGKAHVHPSLGRIAFLLEVDGVKLHWLSGGEDWTGLAADNAADDPAGKKADKLPLKPGDWNTVTLATTADGVKIELNGTVVYDGKLPPEMERLFGLFHYRDKTAARVRNVVLTGGWAKDAAEVAFATKPANPAEAKARRWQLGEKYYFLEAGDIAEHARKLPPAGRYKALADWVLPNDSRPTFQLAGVDKPLDVLGVVDQKQQPDGRRVMVGSRLDAPCLDLIAAAKEAGKLDELAGRVAKADIPAADDLFKRSRAALLAAVRAAQGRDADAEAGLKELLAFMKTMAPDANGSERWPDLIAVTATLGRPALLKAATDLAQAMNENIQQSMAGNKPFDTRDWWVRAYRTARAKAVVAGLPEGVRQAFGSDAGLAHWASVPGLDSWSRSQGWNPPHWSVRDGVVTHYPGHNEDYLLFRTPLRGDFEVTCDLRVQGWAEAHVRYGGHQFDLNHDWKKYKTHTTVRHNGREVTITPPLTPTMDNAYKFRLVVKDGWFRAFVGGREIAAEKIGANPEPWLMLHAFHQNTATIANLKINGTPTVPGKIDLLADDDLGMWRAYLGSVAAGRNPGEGGVGWYKRGEELYEFGKKPEPPEEGKVAPPRGFPESALYYQRPLLEDGVIEYEFYYDPEKAHVHPMLDRLVFILEPDGVKLHWLTDGPHEKSGVAFDNTKDEPDCRRGPTKLPLKAKAWNRVRLGLVDDTVKVTLNGTDVYERAIEPTNQRFFGLFHYTDRTEARVRSMTYAGDWGKALPPADKLFEKK